MARTGTTRLAGDVVTDCVVVGGLVDVEVVEEVVGIAEDVVPPRNPAKICWASVT